MIFVSFVYRAQSYKYINIIQLRYNLSWSRVRVGLVGSANELPITSCQQSLRYHWGESTHLKPDSQSCLRNTLWVVATPQYILLEIYYASAIWYVLWSRILSISKRLPGYFVILMHLEDIVSIINEWIVWYSSLWASFHSNNESICLNNMRENTYFKWWRNDLLAVILQWC